MRTTSDFTPKQKSADALLTRLESAEYISKELGRPLSFSTLQKLCAWGEGPTVAAWWGRRPLYSRNNLHAWVDARSRPKKEALPADEHGMCAASLSLQPQRSKVTPNSTK
jgi:hypothetical protein